MGESEANLITALWKVWNVAYLCIKPVVNSSGWSHVPWGDGLCWYCHMISSHVVYPEESWFCCYSRLSTSTPSTERETCWTALAGQFHLEEEEGLILEIMMEVRHERGRIVWFREVCKQMRKMWNSQTHIPLKTPSWEVQLMFRVHR